MTQFVKTQIFFGHLLLLLSIISCNEKTEVHDSQKFESGKWEVEIVPEFNVNITNIEKKYDLSVKLDISKQFLTQNIWLFYEVKAPDGNIQYDTTEYVLFDHMGKWQGESSGNNISYDLIYKASIGFPEKGIYTFRITQGMRENQTPLVNKIEFVVRESIYSEKK